MQHVTSSKKIRGKLINSYAINSRPLIAAEASNGLLTTLQSIDRDFSKDIIASFLDKVVRGRSPRRREGAHSKSINRLTSLKKKLRIRKRMREIAVEGTEDKSVYRVKVYGDGAVYGASGGGDMKIQGTYRDDETYHSALARDMHIL